MKSLLSASMHKAGSSIADLIILDFCLEKGYDVDRISKRVTDSPLSEEEIYINYQSKMKEEGVYYGMARGIYVKNMPKIYDLSLIIQIRDPRDCITSAYFSYRDSHVPPKNPEELKTFEARRKKLHQLTIDEYARKAIKQYKERMAILINFLERHPDVLLLKYEEMVEDTVVWLERISSFLDQPLTDSLKTRLGAKTDFAVRKEDTSKHKRQVAPGDHIRKLDAKTISFMNEIARDELRYFSYLDSRTDDR